MRYFDKANNIFRLKQQYNADGKPLYIEYTDEQHKKLFDCDEFHYVGQDPVTGLPTQLENTALKTDKAFWRRQRERKCFPLVNRGKVWYDSLSASQMAELQVWYRAWLNITETFTEPAMPSWLV